MLAETLAQLELMRISSPTNSLAANGGSLMDRITRILDNRVRTKETNKHKMKIQTIGIIAAAALLVGGISMVDAKDQNTASLAARIGENDVSWIMGTWVGEADGNSITLSYKWAVKDHVISSHFKGVNPQGNASESVSLIAVNPATGEIEQTGYDDKGKKSTGKWGPKDGMPSVTLTSTSDTGEKGSMAVGFRRIDENNIELQIFQVDDSGVVGDFSIVDLEMKRKKARK